LSSPFPWIKWFMSTVKKYNLSHIDGAAWWLPFVDHYNLAQLLLIIIVRSRWFSVVDSFMRCSRCTRIARLGSDCFTILLSLY
jgi:hypothetical protein